MEKYFKILQDTIEKAYAPYSKFKVAALVEDCKGNIFTGCNIENASYGLTVCAERVAIFRWWMGGGGLIKCICVYTPTDSFTPPCGACRQVIVEFVDDVDIYIFNKDGKFRKYTLGEILPYSFKLKKGGK